MSNRVARLVVWSLLLASPSAHAYVIEQTEESAELHWASFPVEYSINVNGTGDVSGTLEFDAVQAGFDVWDAVTNASVEFTYAGTTTKDYDDITGCGSLCDDATNTVVWTDSWIHSSGVIGLTFNLYYVSSGEIFESDIALNGQHFAWDTGDAPTTIDVQDIVAHESGHFLGLGHSEYEDATMAPTAAEGEISKRDLDPDDEAAIQYLYGPNGPGAGGGTDVPADDPTGGGEFDPGGDDGDNPAADDGGGKTGFCSVRGPEGVSLRGAFLIAALAFVTRRRGQRT